MNSGGGISFNNSGNGYSPYSIENPPASPDTLDLDDTWVDSIPAGTHSYPTYASLAKDGDLKAQAECLSILCSGLIALAEDQDVLLHVDLDYVFQTGKQDGLNRLGKMLMERVQHYQQIEPSKASEYQQKLTEIVDLKFSLVRQTRFPTSWYTLGEELELGQVIPQDLKQAIDCYQQAADLGAADACIKLISLGSQSDDLEKCIEKAWSSLIELWRGDALNQCSSLGKQFELGNGVPVNLEAAMHCYGMALTFGDKAMLKNMILLKFPGEAAPTKLEDVIICLGKYTHYPLDWLWEFLGDQLQSDPIPPWNWEDALRCYQNAVTTRSNSSAYFKAVSCSINHGVAMTLDAIFTGLKNLTHEPDGKVWGMVVDGISEIPSFNKEHLTQCYENAAVCGHAGGGVRAGVRFVMKMKTETPPITQNGDAVFSQPLSDEEMVARLKERTGQSDARINYWIGLFYENPGQPLINFNTGQDNVNLALLWYEKAANEDVFACLRAAHLNLYLGKPSNHKTAYNHYKKAANHFKHPEGLTGLGWLYWNGWGVEQSDQQAFEYYRQAIQQDHGVRDWNLLAKITKKNQPNFGSRQLSITSSSLNLADTNILLQQQYLQKSAAELLADVLRKNNTVTSLSLGRITKQSALHPILNMLSENATLTALTANLGFEEDATTQLLLRKLYRPGQIARTFKLHDRTEALCARLWKEEVSKVLETFLCLKRKDIPVDIQNMLAEFIFKIHDANEAATLEAQNRPRFGSITVNQIINQYPAQ